MNRAVGSPNTSENPKLPNLDSDYLPKLLGEIINPSSEMDPDQLAEGLLYLNHPRSNSNSPVAIHLSWHMAEVLEREIFRKAGQVERASPALITALGTISLNKFSTEVGIQRSLELLDRFDLPVCHYVAALMLTNKDSSDLQYLHALNHLANCDKELILDSATRTIKECDQFRVPIVLSFMLDHFPNLAHRAMLYLQEVGREDLVLSSGIELAELDDCNLQITKDDLFNTLQHERGPDDIVTLGLYAYESFNLNMAGHFLDKMRAIPLAYASRCAMITAASLTLKGGMNSNIDLQQAFIKCPESVSELIKRVATLSI